MSEGSALRKLLRKDDEYAKFKNILQYASSLAEFDNYCAEMETMHQGRKSRTLAHKSISTKRLVDAVLQDASYRSRCVEIMMVVNKASRMLLSATEAIRGHIFSKYKPYLANYRTKAERDTYVNNILKEAVAKLADYERIIEMAKYIIEDIDKMSWSARNILQGLELMLQRENNLIGKSHKV